MNGLDASSCSVQLVIEGREFHFHALQLVLKGFELLFEVYNL
jgi:hypothetical protein